MKLTQIIKPMLIGAVICTMSIITGCHEEEKAQMQADAAAFCQNFKDMNFEAMYELTNDKTKYFNQIYVPDTEGSEMVFRSMADNLRYEIGECEIDGKNATVNAKISNVDMNNAMSNVLNEYFEECEENPENIDNISLEAIIDKNVNDPEAIRREADTVFNFIKQDGEWVLESNVMIYDDVTGGYMTYYFQTDLAVNSSFADVETTTSAE